MQHIFHTLYINNNNNILIPNNLYFCISITSFKMNLYHFDDGYGAELMVYVCVILYWII